MNNLTQLFIRACKSSDPHKRIQSVYRRFYGNYGGANTGAIASILLEINTDYTHMTLRELANEMSPAQSWMYGSDLNYNEMLIKVLSSKIRQTEGGRFPGLTRPASLRIKS